MVLQIQNIAVSHRFFSFFCYFSFFFIIVSVESRFLCLSDVGTYEYRCFFFVSFVDNSSSRHSTYTATFSLYWSMRSTLSLFIAKCTSTTIYDIIQLRDDYKEDTRGVVIYVIDIFKIFCMFIEIF